MKRSFDIIASLIGIIILSPIVLLVGILIIIETKGGIFYKQKRVGKNGILFDLFKFRTMGINSDKRGLLTVGMRDARITKIGFYLRKYKIDELPQLINVLIGDMSFVGPRPEVEKYVKLYNDEQRKVLSIKPGITDLASLLYFNENEILAYSPHPEQSYIETIMPEKLAINIEYIKSEESIFTDIKIIGRTILRIVFVKTVK